MALALLDHSAAQCSTGGLFPSPVWLQSDTECLCSVDLDIEGGATTGYAAFVTRLRSHFNGASKKCGDLRLAIHDRQSNTSTIQVLHHRRAPMCLSRCLPRIDAELGRLRCRLRAVLCVSPGYLIRLMLTGLRADNNPCGLQVFNSASVSNRAYYCHGVPDGHVLCAAVTLALGCFRVT